MPEGLCSEKSVIPETLPAPSDGLSARGLQTGVALWSEQVMAGDMLYDLEHAERLSCCMQIYCVEVEQIFLRCWSSKSAYIVVW